MTSTILDMLDSSSLEQQGRVSNYTRFSTVTEYLKECTTALINIIGNDFSDHLSLGNMTRSTV